MKLYKAQIQGLYKSVSEEGGKHFIELLCSGTKLDKVGDKVAPELLASMKSQADAGHVMLLENHGATLPMGISTKAEIVPADDGTQSLFITFELDDSHPLVPTLLKQIADGYQPQCSIGVDVMTDNRYDEKEGRMVRVLTEGQFEHVALTRPDRAAYGDAMVTLAKSIDEAITNIIKAAPAEENNAMSYKEEMAKRAEACKALRAKMDAAKVAKDSAPAVEKTEPVAKENVEAGLPFPEKKDDVAAAAPPPVEKDDMAMSLDSMKDVHGNIGALHKLMKEGLDDAEATPDDHKAMLAHVMSELELMEQAMASLAAAGDLAPEGEQPVTAEAPPPPPAENPDQPAKEPTKEEPAPEEKTEGNPVEKSIDAAKAEFDKAKKEYESVIKSLTERVDKLEKMPAGIPPQRYNSDGSTETVDYASVVKSMSDAERLEFEKTAAVRALSALHQGKKIN